MDRSGTRAEPLGSGAVAYVTQAHGFGADAVLLAHFAAPKQGARSADLCSGCGIVPLLWCRDNPVCEADAFELLPEAAALARRSAEADGFPNLRVFVQDLRALPDTFAGRYDLVACNPPYRPLGAGRRSTDAVRAAARLLAGKGRFCVCMRPARLAELFGLLAAARLEPKCLRLVQQREDAPPWLALVEARKDARPGLEVGPALFCEQGGAASAAWRELYKPFCP